MYYVINHLSNCWFLYVSIYWLTNLLIYFFYLFIQSFISTFIDYIPGYELQRVNCKLSSILWNVLTEFLEMLELLIFAGNFHFFFIMLLLNFGIWPKINEQFMDILCTFAYSQEALIWFFFLDGKNKFFFCQRWKAV